MRTGRPVASFALISILATASLTACSQRSTEAFCSTMEEHKTRYLEAWSQASGEGAVAGLVGGASAVGDLKIMWDELAEVAPDEIRPDAEAVRDAWKQQEDAAKNGDWMGAVAGGLMNSGSMSRVDQYARENCDDQAAINAEEVGSPVDDVEADGSVGSGEPTSAAPDPSEIQQLGHSSWGVMRNVLIDLSGNNSSTAEGSEGPTVIHRPAEGQVQLDAVQLLPDEDVTGQRWTLAGPDPDPYAVALVEVRRPAQGLEAATYQTRLLTVDIAAGTASITEDTEVGTSACESDRRMVGSHDHAVAIEVRDYEDETTCSNYVTTISARDPQTGDELWNREVERAESWSYGVVTANYPAPEPEPMGMAHCHIVSGLDVATGKTLWELDAREHRSEDGGCLLMQAEPGTNGNSAVNFDTWLITNDGKFERWVETTTGRELKITDHLDHYDPVSGLGVIHSGDLSSWQEASFGLKSLDVFTGEVKYSMERQQFDSLNLEIHGFYSGKIYAGDDERDLVIDATTGDVAFERQKNDRPSGFTDFVHPIAGTETHALFNNGALVPMESIDSYVQSGNADPSDGNS